MLKLSALLLSLMIAKASYVPLIPQEKIHHITCNEGISHKLLQNTKDVYFCTDNQHMIYHSSSLNTLSPGAEDPFVHYEDDFSDKWVEIETNKYTMEASGGIPFTDCLSIEHGDSGAVSGIFTDIIGGGASLDLNWAIVNVLVAQINLSVGASVGATYIASAEYSCSGTNGQTVQLTVVPSYYRFREGKFRFLYPSKNWRDNQVVYEEWQNIPDTQVLVSAPMLKCVTDPDLLRCDSALRTPW